MQDRKCPQCKIRDREKYKTYLRKTCWMCRVGHKTNNERNRKYRASLRDSILTQYGPRCVCCGESNEMFLTFDHVNNDGGKFRKENGKDSTALFRWIINNGYPLSIQVLCFNCNCGKNVNGGICPHKNVA